MRTLLTQFENLARRNAAVESCEMGMGVVGVGRRMMQVNARKIVCDQESQDKLVVVFEDITDRWTDVPTDAGKRRRYEVFSPGI
jgi:hypothetical protein